MNKARMFELYTLLSAVLKDDKKVNVCSLNFMNSNREGCKFYISVTPMKDSDYIINISSSLVDSNRFEVEYEYGKYRTITSIDECLGFIKRLIRIKF